MKIIYPKHLEEGDEIRIIAPSRSMHIISKELKDLAEKRLEALGFKVTYGKNIYDHDDFNSSSISSRLRDLHDAFKDKNVRGIFTVIGGFNSNQLLKYIDWNLIKRNPKILCGYSDITALNGSILRKTGLVTYYGPHFSSLGMKKGLDYTLDYFKKALLSKESYEIKPSEKWSNDLWYKEQEKRKFEANPGYKIINKGKAKGRIIGGNLNTFNLLQGTEFMPSLANSVLFLEDDSDTKPVLFDRDLQSLIQQPGFEGVRGIVIGRFEKASEIKDRLLEQIIKTKRDLKNIPVISGIDFGHTTPQATFPIGGVAYIDASGKKPKIMIERN